MNNTSHILCAYEFLKNGYGKDIRADMIAKKIKSHDLTWVHLDAALPETQDWLRQNADDLDDLIINALVEEETRPRLLEYKDGMMIILRGVNLNEGAEPEDMISIRLWIDPHRIISTQKRSLVAISDLRTQLEQGKGPKNAADFLVMLATHLITHMDQVVSELDERTDNIEEAILDNPDLSSRHEIIDIRRQAIVLRRYIAPQRDVISYLHNSNVKWLTAQHKRELRENLDHVIRYIEDLDAIRERAQIVKDELYNIISDRINRNMYLLSVVAAIFLPLSFLTSLLGINVGGMPGAESPVAFWIVCVLCIFCAGTLIAVFKKMKWL